MYETIISVAEKAMTIFWHCFPYLLNVAAVIMAIVASVRVFLVLTDKIEVPHKSSDSHLHSGSIMDVIIPICISFCVNCLLFLR